MNDVDSMTAPGISICLPNLNTRPFLEERIATILAQTYSNWELVISDNYSDDGAWEYFQRVAESDHRVRISQAPRQGMYANWNRCIRQARGEYVYIATSDDTMAPDCLEKLARALVSHPECDIAHCPLKVIDVEGRDLKYTQIWCTEKSYFARSSGRLRDQPHLRRAPLDGLLLLGGETVYLSLTQLLIRRSLFERVGLFEPTSSSVGDFEWDMRASLVANTVHVPDTWASWRMHPNQATARVGPRSVEYARQIAEMIEHAVRQSEPLLPPNVRQRLKGEWMGKAVELRNFIAGHRDSPNALARKLFILRHLLMGSAPARTYVKTRLIGRDSNLAVDTVREWLREIGLPEPISALGGRHVTGSTPAPPDRTRRRPQQSPAR